ncbi:TPA: hypothetical protein L5G07_001461 [Pseudomonas aeruginosa]|uniref:hypothetical protein n=1 Tax=Pseudomonadota TaxID=1224 RepID=UPI00033579ED|nr:MULTISPECIES: hypothetical protein [Pseudomonadota]RFQ04850.1 hypothetical protein D0O09_05030 [Pseudomonas putida]EIU1410589.1 hypothetical protein [Pseudomonas aeruginosa]EKU7420035.1 hypothetical protein [Pseudomonas aeruginosa]EOT19980.1 hypothetical protein PAK_02450 [Pseudomonas aeruginosa PAK]KSD45157.1 hypothetical protein AO901_08145 [Pseudomonas aeruginosa]
MHMEPAISKVFYRPIEAAIRWAGLLKHEWEILAAVPSPRDLPLRHECPRWRELRLYTHRIYDAIDNGELPFGRNGITLKDESLLRSPELTIRHLDLKRWMRAHYPEHRPPFLFSRCERIAHPIITLEAGQAMLVERQAIKSELDYCRHQLHELQEKHGALLRHPSINATCNPCGVSDRAETTYLHIIGGMVELMLGRSPSGVAYSRFRTQEAIVSALVANYRGSMGITERTLNGKFAIARRSLHSAV